MTFINNSSNVSALEAIRGNTAKMAFLPQPVRDKIDNTITKKEAAITKSQEKALTHIMNAKNIKSIQKDLAILQKSGYDINSNPALKSKIERLIDNASSKSLLKMMDKLPTTELRIRAGERAIELAKSSKALVNMMDKLPAELKIKAGERAIELAKSSKALANMMDKLPAELKVKAGERAIELAKNPKDLTRVWNQLPTEARTKLLPAAQAKAADFLAEASSAPKMLKLWKQLPWDVKNSKEVIKAASLQAEGFLASNKNMNNLVKMWNTLPGLVRNDPAVIAMAEKKAEGFLDKARSPADFVKKWNSLPSELKAKVFGAAKEDARNMIFGSLNAKELSKIWSKLPAEFKRDEDVRRAASVTAEDLVEHAKDAKDLAKIWNKLPAEFRNDEYVKKAATERAKDLISHAESAKDLAKIWSKLPAELQNTLAPVAANKNKELLENENASPKEKAKYEKLYKQKEEETRKLAPTTTPTTTPSLTPSLTPTTTPTTTPTQKPSEDKKDGVHWLAATAAIVGGMAPGAQLFLEQLDKYREARDKKQKAQAKLAAAKEKMEAEGLWTDVKGNFQGANETTRATGAKEMKSVSPLKTMLNNLKDFIQKTVTVGLPQNTPLGTGVPGLPGVPGNQAPNQELADIKAFKEMTEKKSSFFQKILDVMPALPAGKAITDLDVGGSKGIKTGYGYTNTNVKTGFDLLLRMSTGIEGMNFMLQQIDKLREAEDNVKKAQAKMAAALTTGSAEGVGLKTTSTVGAIDTPDAA